MDDPLVSMKMGFITSWRLIIAEMMPIKEKTLQDWLPRNDETHINRDKRIIRNTHFKLTALFVGQLLVFLRYGKMLFLLLVSCIAAAGEPISRLQVSGGLGRGQCDLKLV